MDYNSIAQFYALQYADYTDDLEFYLRLAQDYGGPVLELGAGTGRVTKALVQAGIGVVALELAEQMMRLGQAATGERAEWIKGDMRSLELERQFPLVIAPFNALMHLYSLEDQDRTLRGVVQHLAAGGRLAFDLYNPAHIEAPGVFRYEGRYPGGLEVFLRQEHHAAAQTLVTHYYLDQIVEGRVHRHNHTLTQRYFTRYEVERWLRAFGFRYRLWGGFHGQKYQADSPVMAFVAWLE